MYTFIFISPSLDPLISAGLISKCRSPHGCGSKWLVKLSLYLSLYIYVYRSIDLYISYSRGLVHYTDLLALLRQIDPPLGFGSKCPDLLAYKRLVRMNMPVDEEGKVRVVKHYINTFIFLIVQSHIHGCNNGFYDDLKLNNTALHRNFYKIQNI